MFRRVKAHSVWIAVAVAVAALGATTTAALAQAVSNSGTVTFTIAEAYGVNVNDVTFDQGIGAGTTSSKTFAGTSSDYLFQIVGPTDAVTDSVKMQVSSASLPTGWLYTTTPANPPGYDLVRLTYSATRAEFNGVTSITVPVGISSGSTSTILPSPSSAPIGYYGGTVAAEVGPRSSGGAGSASLTLTVTVTAL